MHQTAVDNVRKDLRAISDPAKAKILQGFFKTGSGEYGEGDVFLGVTVPKSRQVARKFSQLTLGEVKELLYSDVHEERLVALLILVQKYTIASDTDKELITRFYLENITRVNNWDLVDLSAPTLLGAQLIKKDRRILYELVGSDKMWERRIAIVATLWFIRNGDFSDTLKIAAILLHDKHDLIHKATGWMLREVRKRDVAAEESFLMKHCKAMPRTMLRYAIERLPERKKLYYMKKS